MPGSEDAHAEQCCAGHDCKYCRGESQPIKGCDPGLSIQRGPGCGRGVIVPCNDRSQMVTATNGRRAEGNECDEELNDQENGYELFHCSAGFLGKTLL